MNNLGFIGVGLMGLSLVKRLSYLDYKIDAYDKDIEKLEPLKKISNIRLNQNVSEISKNNDIIILCLDKTESVKALSKKFNLSSARLLKFNGLRPTRTLEAKTMILVPLQKTTDKSNLGELWSHKVFTQKTSFFRARIYHRVRKGDTLTKISRQYNVSIKSLWVKVAQKYIPNKNINTIIINFNII